MDTLRVLLVESDQQRSARIVGRLEEANHAVLPASGLDEATQALDLQRFDAVVVGSRLATKSLAGLRDSLNQLESSGRVPVKIPLLCYTCLDDLPVAGAEFSRNQVDGCLEEGFEAATFSELVRGLATKVSFLSTQTQDQHLPILKADEFSEQVGGDSELILEIVDLFLQDSQEQLRKMRAALSAGELIVLSRTAHSLKGSLGSLYAVRAASRAQVLEQVAKDGDRENSMAALRRLEVELEDLQPELQQLRQLHLGL